MQVSDTNWNICVPVLDSYQIMLPCSRLYIPDFANTGTYTGVRVPLFSWFPHFWTFSCAKISAFSCSFSIFLAFLSNFMLFSFLKKKICGLSHLCTLRVRAFFHETVRVCHVYCNFKIGFTCRITVIFGTLNGGSLLINTLASNICFSYRNMFQNGVDALSKIVDAFLSKSSKFHPVLIIR